MGGLSGEEINQFFYEIATNKTAKHLALSICFTSYDDAKKFTEALAENDTLQFLGLDYSSGEIPDYDISLAIASFRSKSLQQLWLEGNYMGSHCAAKIAKCLRENTCPQLQKLFLKNNLLGDGVSAIGLVLRENNILEVLNLPVSGNYSNPIIRETKVCKRKMVLDAKEEEKLQKHFYTTPAYYVLI